MRLLGILRLWRVLRLVRRLVEQERSAHDVTRRVLEQEQVVSLPIAFCAQYYFLADLPFRL
jgi:hypothetical protein